MTAKPICLIIGAGDYIGAAIARRFARGGFHVVMGRRRGEKFAPLIADIEAEGGSAQGFTWDARKEETATEMFAILDPAPPDARRLDPRTGYPPLRRNMVTADSLHGSRQVGPPPDKQKETPCSTNC